MSLHRTRLTLQNAHDETLVAVLTTRGPPPSPLNLDVTPLCHGFLDSKNGRLMTALADNLPIATARVDFSGNGESQGDRKFGNYHKEVSDLRALVQHLRSVGARVTTVVGHSKGGDVVLLYAAEFADVQNVVNLAGRYDMRRGVRERFGEDRYAALLRGESVVIGGARDGRGVELVVTKEDLQQRFAVDMDDTVRRISRAVRVLTVHGGRDDTIAVADAREIHRRIGNGRLVVLEGCGHSFNGFEARVACEIAAFVSKSGGGARS